MTGSSRYLTGYHSINERLNSANPSTRLIVTHDDGRIGELTRKARSKGIPVDRVDRRALQDLAGPAARDCALEIPPGSVSSSMSLDAVIEAAEESNSLVVMLDHVTDPHNLGAVIRSADQFGVDGLVLPDRRSADITPVVVQSSAGATSHVRIARVTNLAAAIEQLKAAGYWIYCADMDGERADRLDLSGRIVIILGAEGRGVSRLIRERSDVVVSVPAAGHVDSFNVSVAAGILLYEVRRQQNWFR